MKIFLMYTKITTQYPPVCPEYCSWFTKMVKAPQFDWSTCTERGRCGSLLSKHALGSCHLSFMRQCTECARASVHCPASICHVVRKYCRLLTATAARCTVKSPLDVCIHILNVRLNLIGLRCVSPRGLTGCCQADFWCLVLFGKSVNITGVNLLLKCYHIIFITY